MALIISISGLRGIVPDELTATVACEYAAVFGTYLREEAGQGRGVKVCVGRDTRPSGPMLAAAAIAGLCSVGVDVIDLGVVTTPTVGLMVRQLRGRGGLVVTASHNAQPYNGIKLIDATGMALAGQKAADVHQRYSDRRIRLVDSLHCGRHLKDGRSDRFHVEKVLNLVDARLIASRCYKVVLDGVNGAGVRPAKRLLHRLGCRVSCINGAPTGIFGRGPEPVEENLGVLCRRVKQTGADIGLAQDPDADRLAIVDADGRCLGEEYTLALAAMQVLQERPGCVVANLSTSAMIDDVAARLGCSVIRTPVGEAHVASAMIQHNCTIGGEGNGGVIDLRVGAIRDSLVAMALVLQLMARTGETVRALADQIGQYWMVKRRFPVPAAGIRALLDAVCEAFPDGRMDRRDGLRCDLAEGWFDLRPSNTEPVVRLVAEARNKHILQGYLQTIEGAVTALDGPRPSGSGQPAAVPGR